MANSRVSIEVLGTERIELTLADDEMRGTLPMSLENATRFLIAFHDAVKELARRRAMNADLPPEEAAFAREIVDYATRAKEALS